MPTPSATKSYSAILAPAPDELVDITLRNDSGHRMTFFVSGIDPEIYATLDGNSSHTMRIPIEEHIDIFVGDKDGELLNTTRIESL